ncbi:MAG: ABC transporter ATP-binding protein [Patescibacteria group bacterium]
MSIIHVKNLSKTFESYKKEPGLIGSIKGLFSSETIYSQAVKDISFDIAEGEFIGFVGPNGAGKTTTLKMLSGILYPTSGDVEVLGFKPFKRAPEFQKQFGLVMGQKNQLWWDLPARESFILNKAIYEVSDHDYKKTLDELTDILDVEDFLDIQVRKLSLGQRMKCELIAALLHSPRILFLDEPTIGLDVVSQRNIREFLSEYNRSRKTTIILTSHYMEDIRRLCKRVIIIDHGSIIYDGDYKNLTEKYAGDKTIHVSFSDAVLENDLKSLGRTTMANSTSAKINVPRKDIAAITNRLLIGFPVDDISISEESIEKIISDIFEGK